MVSFRAVNLSTRSDRTELAPATAGAQPDYRRLLNGESGEATWRIVEVFSVDDLPFLVRLYWSSGSGTGQKAWFTVSKATRICVNARTITVEVANLSTLANNRVGVTVDDGFSPTENYWQEAGETDGVNPVVVDIPPHARSLKVHLLNTTILSGSTITLQNADGTDVGSVSVATALGTPLWVGTSRRVKLTTSAATKFVAVFELGL